MNFKAFSGFFLALSLTYIHNINNSLSNPSSGQFCVFHKVSQFKLLFASELTYILSQEFPEPRMGAKVYCFIETNHTALWLKLLVQVLAEQD